MERGVGCARRMDRPGCGIVDVGACQDRNGIPGRVILVETGILARLHVFPQLNAREDIVGIAEILHIDVFVPAIKIIVQPAARIAARRRLVECRLADGAPGIGARHSDDNHQYSRNDSR